MPKNTLAMAATDGYFEQLARHQFSGLLFSGTFIYKSSSAANRSRFAVLFAKRAFAAFFTSSQLAVCNYALHLISSTTFFNALCNVQLCMCNTATAASLIPKYFVGFSVFSVFQIPTSISVSFLLHPYTPSLHLHSTSLNLLSQPRINITLASCGFRHAGPFEFPLIISDLPTFTLSSSPIKRLTFSLVQASLAPCNFYLHASKFILLRLRVSFDRAVITSYRSLSKEALHFVRPGHNVKLHPHFHCLW